MDLLHTAHVPAGDGPFATILALHGWGASAHDLLGIAPYIHGGQALFVCPQGPMDVPIGPGAVGHGWFPISGGGPIDPGAVVAARMQLEGFLDEALDRYPIDRTRLVVLGFSQGGVMAYDLALRSPDRFSGLVALSSWLPDFLFDSLPEDDRRRALPTLVIHGKQDPMIPIQRGHESIDRLRDLGLQPAWGEYEMGHEIRPDALRDLIGWLADGPLQVKDG